MKAKYLTRLLCTVLLLAFLASFVSILAADRTSSDHPAGASEQKAGQSGSGTADHFRTSGSSKSEAAAVSHRPESIPELTEYLEEIYGIRILYGDDVPRKYTDYTVNPVTDKKKIRSILRIVEDALSAYPPGFFRAVKDNFCDSICICLAGSLQAIDANCYMDSTEAFTTVKDDRIWLVLNAEDNIQKSTVIHELTHAADYRLLSMKEISEEEWSCLNPPSFQYYNAYLDEKGESYRFSGSREYTSLKEKDPDRIYFYDPYSKTFAMEDRARLMEKLLEDPTDRCFSSPHVRTKLRFYFYTLRAAFGSGDWPEKTSWEAALAQITN